MIFYKITKTMDRSLKGDTEFIDIVAREFQGDTLKPCMLLNYLNYVLQTSLDLIKENDFTFKKDKKVSIFYGNCDRRRQC